MQVTGGRIGVEQIPDRLPQERIGQGKPEGVPIVRDGLGGLETG